MKRYFIKCMSFFLALLMLVTTMPLQALAYMAEKKDSLTVLNKDGQSVSTDASWETTFPYGTFAFEYASSTIKESEESIINVYRLGGTQGKAKIFLTYEPTVAQIDENEYNFINAIGHNDIEIYVEDALPITQYQPYGKREDAKKPATDIEITVTDIADTAPSTDDAEPPVVESKPMVESEPVVESTPIVESTPVVESEPMVETTPLSVTPLNVEIKTEAEPVAEPTPAPVESAPAEPAPAPAEPESAPAPVESTPTEPTPAPVEPAPAEPIVNDVLLNSNVTADSYQWYVMYQDSWEKIQDATEASLKIAKVDLYDAQYDFRVEYKIGEDYFMSNSFKGVVYQPEEADVLPEMPEDFVETNEQTFSLLPILENDEFDGRIFEMTFADGEYVKQIKLKGAEDLLPEADEFATLTIVDCYGGELYDTANTLAIHVVDNEPIEKSEIDFEVTEIKADKSSGDAILTVKRKGSVQNALSIEYKTKDGTAKDGVDYTNTKGTLMFYGAIDELEIKVPLINNKIETEELLDFTVELYDLKGDGDDKCTVLNDSATVSLYNTNTSTTDNLSTTIYDETVSDVSGSVSFAQNSIVPQETVVTGEQVEETPNEPATLKKPNFFTPASLDYGKADRTYSLDFSNNGNLWKDTVVMSGTVYGGQQKDVNHNNWSGGSSSDNGWKYTYTKTGHVSLSIPNASKKYDSVYATFNFTPGVATFFVGKNYTYPYFSLANSKNNTEENTYIDAKQYSDWPKLYWWPNQTLSENLDFDGDIQKAILGTIQNNNLKADATGIIERLTFTRRTFKNNFGLIVHTANDDGAYGEKTAPQNCAELSWESGFYNDFIPKVSIINGEGGIGGWNKLYVGSKLSIDTTIPNASTFALPNNTKLNKGIMLTNKAGDIVTYPTGSGSSRTLTLLWDSLDKESELSDHYALNVVLTRNQKVKVDLTPSIPRVQNGGTSIDTSKIEQTANNFWKNYNITYGYSEVTNTLPYFNYKDNQNLADSNFAPITSGSPEYQTGNLENLQWICFNGDEEDLFVFNGRSYSGNEKIYLTKADLTTPTITFRYYNKDFIGEVSTMEATISEIAIFIDGNNNGKIDGDYNRENGRFELDKKSEDFIEFTLKPNTNYDETRFAPVKDENGVYHQRFAKVYYTMSPRSLVVPEGEKEDDYAQVLPAFVTSVTDPTEFASLSAEQKMYRYIISGKDSKNNYTSDNHLMYTAAATAMSYVDIPLGGDYSPITKEGTGENMKYVWNPNYKGNLMYKFKDPKPISYPDSSAGQNIPVAKVDTINDDGTVVYQGSQATAEEKLNDYLGSLTANDTFALSVREQEQTTGAIIGGSASSSVKSVDGKVVSTIASVGTDPNGESTTISTTNTYPNPESNQNIDTSANKPDTAQQPNDNPNQFPEFDAPTEMSLPEISLGVTDWITIITEGNRIGFSIGVKLGSYISDKKNATTDGWHGLPQREKENAEKFGAMKDFITSAVKKGETFKSGDDSYENAKPGNMSSRSFEVSFNISLAMMFEYNPIDNYFVFNELAVTVSASLDFRLQYRFQFCPIIYVYVATHIGIEIGTGLSTKRIVETEDNSVNNVVLDLKSGSEDKFVFTTDTKAFDITFNGKLKMEVYDSYNTATDTGTKDDDFDIREIASKGDTLTTVLYTKMGMDTDGTKTVVLTPVDDTNINSIYRITGMEFFTYFNGLTISPDAFVEVGAGAGVELAKIEVFIKISIACSMYIGGLDPETMKYDPFVFQSFDFAAAIGFRIVLLLFNYEMEAVTYKVGYEHGDGWSHGFEFLGGAFSKEFSEPMAVSTIKSQNLPSGKTSEAQNIDVENNQTFTQTLEKDNTVRITLPMPPIETQEIYEPEQIKDPNVSYPLAFNPSNKEVPFQLSGYGSASDGFKLIDGVTQGYDYKVITVGNKNYVLYTIAQASANVLDASRLVLSELVLTNANGDDSYGFANPIDNPSSQKYIFVDTIVKDSKLENDIFGDLAFDAWVEGDIIHTSFVSYKEDISLTEPTTPNKNVNPLPSKTTEGTTITMGIDNYKDETIFPVVTKPSEAGKPSVVEQPDTILPTEPTEVTAPTEVVEPTEVIEPDEKDTNKYPEGITDSKYIADKAVYDQYIADKSAYGQYVKDKATYDQYVKNKKAWDELKADWDKYEQYVIDEKAYDVSVKEYENYNVWYEYFESLESYNNYVANLNVTASKNTIIKTASFDTTKTEGFTASKVIGDNNGTAQNFLPNITNSGNLSTFVKVNKYYDVAEEKAQYDMYEKVLQTQQGTQTGLTGGQDVENSILTFQKTNEKANRDLYGYQNSLVANYTYNNKEYSTVVNLAAGQTVENMELTTVGGKNYVVYTTKQIHYVDDDGNATKDLTKIVDMVKTYKLTLNEITIASNGKPSFGTAKVIRTLVDFEIDDKKDKSGTDVFVDPNFGNFKFLNGKLTSATKEEFLLFDMNGNTYVLPQADIVSVLSGGGVTITPFFSVPEDEASGKGETTIGADGAGNISAVYTQIMPNTTNNALYVSKYDEKTKTWGEGTMLAMNFMDVYEDGVKNNTSAEDLEKAYLDPSKKGGMESFTFENIQIALGQTEAVSSSIKSVDANGLASVTNKQTTVTEPYSVTPPTKSTLLVLTQGNMNYLKEVAMADGTKAIRPQNDSESKAEFDAGKHGEKKYGLGLYAISYGIGGQAIGEDTISFIDNNFSAGYELAAKVNFTNTGDVAIRASESQPATVKLLAKNASTNNSQELATWQITKNIVSGQKVELTGNLKALDDNLPKGSIFYITVEEDQSYTSGNGFMASTLKTENGKEIGTFIVEEKAELGFEEFKITQTGIDENGNSILDVDFTVGNRGNKQADDVYVQFTYEANNNGTKEYRVLSLNASNLIVGKQKVLPNKILSNNILSSDKSMGILRLANAEDGNDMEINHGRQVTGDLVVPASVFNSSENSNLNIRVEIYSADDTNTADIVGVKEVIHGEYDATNNVSYVEIIPTTYFTSATNINLALGNTMRLPLHLATTTGKPANLQVIEIPTKEAEMVDGKLVENKNLGILYYSSTSSAKGNEDGTLVMSPTQEGEGVIHVKDIDTNTIFAINYTVTPVTEGINIYNDNDLFTFTNADGTTYDAKNSINNTWKFKGKVPSWGTENEIPYVNNLSVASKGDKFSFDTVCENLTIYHTGDIEVASDFPNFKTQSIAISKDELGEITATTIYFGSNPNFMKHNVSVTATGQLVQFDKMVEKFSNNKVPLPADDTAAPHIYYSRSFPDTASIVTGSGSVDLKISAIDATKVTSILVNGKEPTGITETGNLKEFILPISSNGKYEIEAFDEAGNVTKHTINVDWFNNTTTVGATNIYPTSSSKFTLEDGTVITKVVGENDKALLKVTAPADTTTTVTYLNNVVVEGNKAELVEEPQNVNPDGTFSITKNGYYNIVVTDAKGNFSSEIKQFNFIDKSKPIISATTSSDMSKLVWSVTKTNESVATLTEVTINGYPLTIESDKIALSGEFDISHSGIYVMVAKDTAGNETTEQFIVKDYKVVPVEDTITFTNAYNKDATNGTLTLDVSNVKGGNYTLSSTPNNNVYVGSYQFTAVLKANDYNAESGITYLEWLTDLLADDTLWHDSQMTNLQKGEYSIYIRDAIDEDNKNKLAKVEVEIKDTYITFANEIVDNKGSVDKGSIKLTAQNGFGEKGLYQFIITPLTENPKDPKDPKAPKYTMLDIDKLPGSWQNTESLVITNVFDFENLATGMYQVAVRDMVGLSTADLTQIETANTQMLEKLAELNNVKAKETESYKQRIVGEKSREIEDLRKEWDEDPTNTTKENAYKSAINNSQDILDALALVKAEKQGTVKYNKAYDDYMTLIYAQERAKLDAQVTSEVATAQTEYNTKQTAYNNIISSKSAIVDTAYANDPTLWENASTEMLEIKYIDTYVPIPPETTPEPPVEEETTNTNAQKGEEDAEDILFKKVLETIKKTEEDTVIVDIGEAKEVPDYIWKEIFKSGKMVIFNATTVGENGEETTETYYLHKDLLPKNFDYNTSHSLSELTEFSGEKGLALSETILATKDDMVVLVDEYEDDNENVKVVVSGKEIEKGSILIVEPLELSNNPEGLTEYEKEIIEILNSNDVVLEAYDIYIKNNTYKGLLNVAIHIGEEYNGKTLSVLHLHNDEYTVYTSEVIDGVISMVVDGLSPFIVLKEGTNLDMLEKDMNTVEKPIPVNNIILPIAIALLALVVIFILILIKKRKKDEDENINTTN